MVVGSEGWMRRLVVEFKTGDGGEGDGGDRYYWWRWMEIVSEGV